MGCACKRSLKNAEKYNDDPIEEQSPNIIKQITQKLVQLCFGVIVGCLLIVVSIPFLFYVIGCLMLGKEPHLMIKRKYLALFKQ